MAVDPLKLEQVIERIANDYDAVTKAVKIPKELEELNTNLKLIGSKIDLTDEKIRKEFVTKLVEAAGIDQSFLDKAGYAGPANSGAALEINLKISDLVKTNAVIKVQGEDINVNEVFNREGRLKNNTNGSFVSSINFANDVEIDPNKPAVSTSAATTTKATTTVNAMTTNIPTISFDEYLEKFTKSGNADKILKALASDKDGKINEDTYKALQADKENVIKSFAEKTKLKEFYDKISDDTKWSDGKGGSLSLSERVVKTEHDYGVAVGTNKDSITLAYSKGTDKANLVVTSEVLNKNLSDATQNGLHLFVTADIKKPMTPAEQKIQTFQAAKEYFKAYSEFLAELDPNTVISSDKGKDKAGKDIIVNKTIGDLKVQIDAQVKDLDDPAKAKKLIDGYTEMTSYAYIAGDLNGKSIEGFKKYLGSESALIKDQVVLNASANPKYQTAVTKLQDMKKAFFATIIEDEEELKIFDNAKKKVEDKGPKNALQAFKDQHQGDFIGVLIELLEKAFPKIFGGRDTNTPTVAAPQTPHKSGDVLVNDLRVDAASKHNAKFENFKGLVGHKIFCDEVKFVHQLGDEIDKVAKGDELKAALMRNDVEVQDFIHKASKRGSYMVGIDIAAVNQYVAGNMPLEKLKPADRDFAKEYKEAMESVKKINNPDPAAVNTSVGVVNPVPDKNGPAVRQQ